MQILLEFAKQAQRLGLPRGTNLAWCCLAVISASRRCWWEDPLKVILRRVAGTGQSGLHRCLKNKHTGAMTHLSQCSLTADEDLRWRPQHSCRVRLVREKVDSVAKSGEPKFCSQHPHQGDLHLSVTPAPGNSTLLAPVGIWACIYECWCSIFRWWGGRDKRVPGFAGQLV